MKEMYCKTCMSFEPDDNNPGYGVCGLSDCEVCGQCQGCMDWRYYKIGHL